MSQQHQDRSSAAIHAVRLASPVTLDGRLDEAAWATARAYPLELPGTGDGSVQEPARVQFAYDDAALYLAFAAEDRDVVAEATEDGLLQFQHGDTLELFIGLANDTWYHEFHATPAGFRSALFMPGPGRRALPGTRGFAPTFELAVHVDGTLNAWRDEDRGWTAELRIPFAALVPPGEPAEDFDVGPHTPWRVLVARYNYGRHLANVELSTAPRLPAANFHLVEHYAPLKLGAAQDTQPKEAGHAEPAD